MARGKQVAIGRQCFLGIGLLVLLAACGVTDPRDRTPATVTLTVSAAASLQGALVDIGKAYGHQPLNVAISYNFGSSGSLQQQIEQGAPVDVFISAAPRQMDALESKALLLADSRKDLLKNQVVLAVPKTASGISDFKDLTGDRAAKIAMGDPDSVPAGQYAREVLIALKIYDLLGEKLVFAKDVNQVLAYVETGNVDAGFVYASDTKRSKQIGVIAVAEANLHSPIIYPVAVLKDSKHPEAAQAFVQFLFSNAAKSLFEDHGFRMANDSM